MQFFASNKSNSKTEWQQQKQAELAQKQFGLLTKGIENQIKQNYSNYHLASQRARTIKWEGIENIAELLEQFEDNWEESGNKIIWAAEAQTALNSISQKFEEQTNTNCFITNSSEIVEMELTALLEKKGIKFHFLNWENQLSYDLNLDITHPVFPLLGFNEADILKKSNTIYETDHKNYQDLQNEYRQFLYEQKNENTFCILCADYIVPEFGGLVFNDQSGYINWCLSNFKNIIVLAGIDRVLVDDDYINELSLIDSTNKTATSNNQLTFIFSPTNKNLNLILLDNARSDLLKNPYYRKLLYDLDGTIWHNSHPDAAFINPNQTHAYHLGPISALLTPLLYAETENNKLLEILPLWKNKLPNPYKLNYLKALMQFKREFAEQKPETKENSIKAKLQGFLGTKDNFYITKQSIGPYKQLPKMANKSFLQSLKN